MSKKILVLEDDLPSLKLIKAILEKYNYEVIESSESLHAIQLAKDLKPNLAIIDVMLPTLNGYQVCERLREIPALQSMPIIVLTVLNEDQHRIRAIEAGATDFLTKPFDRVELLTKIKALLSVQEERSHCEPFDRIFYCFMTALSSRNPEIIKKGQRIVRLADQIALQINLPMEDITEMKLGIMLQDVGQLGMSRDIHSGNQKETTDDHRVLGYNMFIHFDRPVIKTIILHHHDHLKSDHYPSDLPADMIPLLNIAALCNHFDTLYYNISSPALSDIMTVIEEETRQGCWDKNIYHALKDLAANPEMLPHR